MADKLNEVDQKYKNWRRSKTLESLNHRRSKKKADQKTLTRTITGKLPNSKPGKTKTNGR